MVRVVGKGDKEVTQTVADTAGTKAANKKLAKEQAENLKPVLAGRAVEAEAVNSRLNEAVGLVGDVGAATVKRAEELNAKAKTEFEQYGFVADATKAELDRLATEGQASLRALKGRIDELDAEYDRLLREAQSQQGAMNRAKIESYRSRLETLQAERAELIEQVRIGEVAAQERGPVRSQLSRAEAKQRELAAQVGEGPLGAARAAPEQRYFQAEQGPTTLEDIGRTLPQEAQKRYAAESEQFAELQREAIDDLEFAEALAKDPESVARMASETVGRPVRTGPQLSTEKARIGGATLEGREAVVEQAVTQGVTKKGSHALTDADRRAARRRLSREELADPNILSDEVTNNVPPDFVKDFYDTQVALREALIPYSKSNLAEEAAPLRPLSSPELNAATSVVDGADRRVEHGHPAGKGSEGVGSLPDAAEAGRRVHQGADVEGPAVEEGDGSTRCRPHPSSGLGDGRHERRRAGGPGGPAGGHDGPLRGGREAGTGRREPGRRRHVGDARSIADRAGEDHGPPGAAPGRRAGDGPGRRRQADGVDGAVAGGKGRRRQRYETEAELKAEEDRRWAAEQKARADADDKVLQEAIRKESAQGVARGQGAGHDEAGREHGQGSEDRGQAGAG